MSNGWQRQLLRIAASVIFAVLIGYWAGRKLNSNSIDESYQAQVTADVLLLDMLAPDSSTGWNQVVLVDYDQTTE